MGRCRRDALCRIGTTISGSRRQLAGGLLGSAMGIGVAWLPPDGATAKKKRKGKRKKKAPTCPTGETRCPRGFPSGCCPAETACCDTSRLGCCAV